MKESDLMAFLECAHHILYTETEMSLDSVKELTNLIGEKVVDIYRVECEG